MPKISFEVPHSIIEKLNKFFHGKPEEDRGHFYSEILTYSLRFCEKRESNLELILKGDCRIAKKTEKKISDPDETAKEITDGFISRIIKHKIMDERCFNDGDLRRKWNIQIQNIINSHTKKITYEHELKQKISEIKRTLYFSPLGTRTRLDGEVENSQRYFDIRSPYKLMNIETFCKVSQQADEYTEYLEYKKRNEQS